MNIFIAGLSYNISDSDLTELFADKGGETMRVKVRSV